MTTKTYLAYLLTLAASMPTPGPAMLQAMTLGMRHGPRPVAAAALGNACATGLQVTAILFGLSLLAREPILLRLVRLTGTAYLAWLGLRLWRAPCRLVLPADGVPTTRLTGLFGQGLLVAAVNPKAWGFLSAMLPPFAAAGMPDAAGVALLVSPVCLIGFGGMMAYAVFGSWLVRVLASPVALRRVFRLMAVVIWICAAFFAAG
ncbi:LysE family translocator [Desulfovibrio sp. TomC]|uniref:LysE family translocator n=1 Tax=Desulfovibrio sp. TomC TaxID=1562888 RepID=UPI00057472BA|nr:LysE family translocator [Desulfovibrio sp. TomC]KHK01962.1 putative threonine efflux protein [Desulfovibrio sp. TomC]